MPSTLFHRRLSYADVPASEQFDAFRQHMAPLFAIERPADPNIKYNTGGDAYLLGDLWFYQLRFPPARYVRSADRARRDNVDFLVVNAYTRGQWRGALNGEEVERQSEYLQILDCSREQTYETGPVHYCGVALRRQEIEDRLGDVRQAADFFLEGPRADFLHDYIRLLGRQLPNQSRIIAHEVERATYDFVAACLHPSPDLLERARPTLDSALLSRAKRFVRVHLEDATLTPGTICRELGLSRRTLYRIFEPTGGVGRYIQDVRLQRIHDELRFGDAEPIADIAARYGFENKEVFWRAFKRRFGVTPGDVRRGEIQRGAAVAPRAAQKIESMQPWIDHLCR
jgi:AraC-like DNA-binding protein